MEFWKKMEIWKNGILVVVKEGKENREKEKEFVKEKIFS